MMKSLNGFKAAMMASIIMPIALVNIAIIAGKTKTWRDFLDEKYTYESKKHRQFLVGWTALAGASFFCKSAFDNPPHGAVAAGWVNVGTYQRLAKVCGRVGFVASIPLLTYFGTIFSSAMTSFPAMKLAEKKYGSFQNQENA
jgi:hypothetical protein